MNRTTNIHQYITEHNTNIDYIKKSLLLKQCNLNYWNNGRINYTKFKPYAANSSESINDVISNGYISTTNGESILYIKDNTVYEITHDFVNSTETTSIKMSISYTDRTPISISYIHPDNKDTICITFTSNEHIVFDYYNNYVFKYSKNYIYNEGIITNVCTPLVSSYIYTPPQRYDMLGINILEQPAPETQYEISQYTVLSFYLNVPYIIVGLEYARSILFTNTPSGLIENITIVDGIIYREIITMMGEIHIGSQTQIKDKTVVTYPLPPSIKNISETQYIVNTTGRYMYYYFKNTLWNEVKVDKITKQMWITTIHSGNAIYKNNFITIYNERYQYYNFYGKIFKIYSNDVITNVPVALSINSIPIESTDGEQKHMRINNNILLITSLSPNILIDGEIICQKEKYEYI